ncbi:unnamed protein product [Linum trigynum]|uniref:Uncharacterized protein n=1 Tax=Linum trigynum TaxID=586398 RepID=A0AAV2E2A3_9ROSI
MIYPSTVVLAGKHRLNEGIDYNFEGYKMAGREIVGVGNLDSSASGNSVASSPHSHEKIPWYIGGEIQKFVVHRLTTFFSFGGEIHKFPWFIILLYLGMAMVQVRGGFLGTQTRPVVGRVQVRKAASIESSDELRVNLQLRSRPQNPSSPPE